MNIKQGKALQIQSYHNSPVSELVYQQIAVFSDGLSKVRYDIIDSELGVF